MKPIVMKVGVGVFVIVSAFHCIHAHASVVGASHGNHSGAGLGPAGGQAAAGQAASVGSKGAAQAGSNGGRYSMADNYQPWPQGEMQQFAKPHFEVYAGK